ncbi:MurR/RpiR family transcriptional regulator [Amedibacterium intestinale]|uniref:MurR/RpiR family transcriptional regulator n=1 Tax=Amedibacterium intestinale TaxID=2583452 RepID=UPI000E4A1E43|nr:MurR/RpiR family transcriptional regulator [Amedibacterium intestinale]RHO19453.1 MurR/RpiR family transcriptional regulator [Eubacterium sp. AM18-26]RHO22839.1 MurR/RpiR family transcriptional regulator [Eubacterium sp. AM18-10LB-B]RHO27536.1 MurR/RpiR family transcriptional regulator [Erysipelotrichaceae bacterium AM17-60]
MSKKDVLEIINDHYDELFSAEKKVADFVLNYPEKVIMLNVSELSSNSGASEATVVRACKHLGFDGYYQMRLLLSRSLGKSEQKDISVDMNSVQKIFSYEVDRIHNLANSIHADELLMAAKLILQSSVVHIVGVGNTVPIVMDLGFRLERNGIRCMYNSVPELFYNHISLAGNNDIVIAFSRTGASTQVVRAVEYAREKGMKIIVVTGELNKQLVDKADCVIHIKEKRTVNSYITKPDSHLLEYAINDVLVMMVKNLSELYESDRLDEIREENVERLLSEFKL